MNARQGLLESVRAVVSGRLQDQSQIRDIAMRVAEESAVLRRRIERAVGYARKGLRLEACAEAEAEPSVFELAKASESAEMRQWLSLCKRERLPMPEPVPTDALAEIEEAIDRTAPLRGRLALMRRLVLSEGSAWLRLENLRRLADKDPDNPAWQDDVAALEPVAARELCDSIEALLRRGKLEEAEESLQRLEDGGWRWAGAAMVAADLRPRLNSAFADRILLDVGRAVLRLESERAAENEEGSRAEVATVEALVGQLSARGADVPAALAGRIADVERWLQMRRSDADARREGLARVDELDRLCRQDGATLAQLRTALRLAEGTVEGVPEELGAIARRRIHALERSRNLRRALAVAAAAVVVAAAGVAAFLAVRSNQRLQRIESFVAAIRSNVDAGRLAEADRQLTEAEADATIAGDGRVVEARAYLARARDAAAGRALDFSNLMAEAGDPESRSARLERVEEAKKYVDSESQQAAVADWIRRHRDAVARRRDERVRAGKDEVGAVRAKVVAAKPTAAASWDGQLAQWEAAVQDVQRNFGDLEEVRAEIDAVRVLVDSQRARVNDLRRSLARGEMLDGLGASAKTIEGLSSAIERYVADHPGTPEAGDLRRALEDRPLWESVVGLSSIAPLPTDGLALASQSVRNSVIESIERYRERHPRSPFLGDCDELVSLLKAAPLWHDQWLSSKLSAEEHGFGYWSVEMTDGSRRYCRRDPRLTPWVPQPGTQSKIVYALKSCKDRSEELESIDRRNVKQSGEGESPQMLLAARLRVLLENEDAPNDIALALDALKLIRDSESLDGAIAGSLSRGIVESLLREKPTGIDRQLQDAAKRLAREKPEEVDWIAAKDANARNRSRAIREAVLEVVQPDRWRREYAEAMAAECAPLARRFVPAGALRTVDGDAAFLPVSADFPPSGAELLAVDPGAGGAGSRIVPVGKVGPDGAELLPSARQFPAGTMVFVESRGAGK